MKELFKPPKAVLVIAVGFTLMQACLTCAKISEIASYTQTSFFSLLADTLGYVIQLILSPLYCLIPLMVVVVIVRLGNTTKTGVQESYNEVLEAYPWAKWLIWLAVLVFVVGAGCFCLWQGMYMVLH